MIDQCSAQAKSMSKFFKDNRKRGASLITTLVILTFVAILGFMTLSIAILNARMRGMNLSSNRNFYEVESAADEIYAGLGQDVTDLLNEAYQQTYRNDSIGNPAADRTNDDMNHAFRSNFLTKFEEFAGIKVSAVENKTAVDGSKLTDFCTLLRNYSDHPKAVGVSMKEIEFSRDSSSDLNAYNEIRMKELCITYEDLNRGVKSSVTFDMDFSLPEFVFTADSSMNQLSDYALISGLNTSGGASDQDGILEVNKDGNAEIIGNFKTNGIEINKSHLITSSPRILCGGDILISDSSTLGVNLDKTQGTGTSLWADNVILSHGSTLTVNRTDLYLGNDLVMDGDSNTAKIGGSLTGYGAGVPDDSGNNTSSSIVMNGKNNLLDLNGLRSLILAGRAYLDLSDRDEADSGTYPLSESVAVQASQLIYLIPPEDLTVSDGSNSYVPMSNPIIESNTGVTITDTASGSSCLVSADPVPSAGSGIYAYSDGNSKIYVFRNFDNDTDRNAYLKNYLADHAESFNDLMKLSFSNKKYGIKVGDNTNKIIKTAGDLYTVYDGSADGNVFNLVSDGNANEDWNSFHQSVSQQFEQEQKSIANCIDWSKLNAVGDQNLTSDHGQLMICSGNAEVKVKDSNATVNSQALKKGAWLIAGGNVNVTGSGTIEGTIIAGGDVTVTGIGTFEGTIVAGGKVIISPEPKSSITLRYPVNKTYDQDLNKLLAEAAKNNPDNKDDLAEIRAFLRIPESASEQIKYTDWISKANWRREYHSIENDEDAAG